MGDHLPLLAWFFLSYGLTVLWTVMIWKAWTGPEVYGPTAGSLFSVSRLRWVALATIGLLVLVALAFPATWLTLTSDFGGDSFFTLSPLQGLGLLFLNGIFLFILFWLSAAKSIWLQSRHPSASLIWFLRTLLDLGLTALLWGTATLITPQLYYAYYRMIFTGLPRQWVIKFDLATRKITTTIDPVADTSLAHLFTAYTFWALILLCLLAAWQLRPRPWRAAPSLVGFLAGTACALLWWRQFA